MILQKNLSKRYQLLLISSFSKKRNYKYFKIFTTTPKFNLKLENIYQIPLVENSLENRTFKTSAKEILRDTNIEEH